MLYIIPNLYCGIIYKNLKFFEAKFFENGELNLLVSLAGDLHHYARYEKIDGDRKYNKITSGGGGKSGLPIAILITGAPACCIAAISLNFLEK